MLRKSLHILLALWVLTSSMGFVFNKHFCQSELKHVQLFLPSKSCHDSAAARSCPLHPPQEEPKDCCQNESDYFKLEQDQQLTDSHFELSPPQLTVPVLFHPSLLEGPVIDQQTIHFLNYKPPLLVRDFPVFLQTFLC